MAKLFLLDVFLKIDYRLYGLHVVEQMIRGQDWGHSDPWPGLGLFGPFSTRYSV